MQSSYYLSLLTFICLATINCYNPCSVAKFADYSFDLTGLKNFTLPSQDNKFYARLYPCTPTACDKSSQKSFIQKVGNAQCQGYSINATIVQNFQYIDSKSPKTGISIKYLPLIYINKNDEAENKTIYMAQLNIYCPTTMIINEVCRQNNIISQSGNKKAFVNNIVCSISNASGCPFLTTNNFWQFLYDKNIWFAIIIWIFAIFQLFMGYFVIRLTILLYGILTGAVFGIIFSAQSYQNFFNDDNSDGIIVFIVLISFLMGILFGFSLLTLPRLGYVNIGMWDAIIFSLLLQNSVLYLTGSMLGFYITLGISCLIMFAISLLRFRKFIILSTPFISAFWIIRTLGFVLPYYPNEFASQKLFAINASTPWQFYLYLASIIILSVLGCAFQFCWYRKKGRDRKNKGYYLEDDQNLRDKLKNFLQFKDVKNFINAGKEQMLFLKKLVVDRESNQQRQVKEQNSKQKLKQKPRQIQLVKMPVIKDKKDRQDKNNNSRINKKGSQNMRKNISQDSEDSQQKRLKVNQYTSNINSFSTQGRKKNNKSYISDKNVNNISNESEEQYDRQIEIRRRRNGKKQKD